MTLFLSRLSAKSAMKAYKKTSFSRTKPVNFYSSNASKHLKENVYFNSRRVGFGVFLPLLCKNIGRKYHPPP